MEYKVKEFYETEFGNFTIGDIIKVEVKKDSMFYDVDMYVGRILNIKKPNYDMFNCGLLNEDVLTIDCSKEFNSNIEEIRIGRIENIEKVTNK